MITEFNNILDKEDDILDRLVIKQNNLRNAVIEKDWEQLTVNIQEINEISDEFQKIDTRRDELQREIKTQDLKPYFTKLSQVRSKLLKCKVENRVLNDYVTIAKNFIQEVVEKALPQSRNKNYTKTGKILQPQPQSVVLNQLF